MDQSALEKVISGYTKEAGVRGLERQLAIICRKAALKYLEENCEQIEVTPDNLSDYLGRERFRKEEIAAKGEPGIVRGLAWTSVGGVTLEVEVNVRSQRRQHLAVYRVWQVSMVLKVIGLKHMIYIFIFQRVQCQRMVRVPELRWQRQFFLQ